METRQAVHDRRRGAVTAGAQLRKPMPSLSHSFNAWGVSCELLRCGAPQIARNVLNTPRMVSDPYPKALHFEVKDLFAPVGPQTLLWEPRDDRVGVVVPAIPKRHEARRGVRHRVAQHCGRFNISWGTERPVCICVCSS